MSTTGMTDEEMEQAVREVAGKPSYQCDDCDFVAGTKASLAQHRRHQHPAPKPERAPRAPRQRPEPAPSDLVAAEVIGRGVANLKVIGGYLSIVLPHTGLAIAGVPGEREGEADIVQSRADLAGVIIAKWARRDPRVLKAVDRFNRLFETSEIAELAVSMGAAVAVDLGAVPADLSIEVGPFTGERAIQPVRSVIGDVIEYVQFITPPPAHVPDGRAPDGAAVYEGGVTAT